MKTKKFTREEMYEYLKFIMFCKLSEIDNLKACTSYFGYQQFLEGADVHFGDCTKDPCPCSRCHLQMIEIEAQNALDILWSGDKGHCGKICLKECKNETK